MATWKKVLHESSPSGDFPSGVALANLGGGSGTTFLRKDGTWATPTDTNTTYSAGTGLSLSSTTFSISSGGVGTTQLANDGVTNAKIADEAIDDNKLADNAVTTNAIANDAVTGAKMAHTTITTTNMSIGGTATTYYPLTFAPTGSGMFWTQIKTAAIEDSAVTSAKIGTSAVSSAKLGTSAVTTTKISDGSVTAAKLSSDPLYVLSYNLQMPVLTGRYYMPNASYGASYHSWDRYMTSIPTRLYFSSTYNMPIVVPKAGRIVKWGFNGAGNSSLIQSCTWYLRYGTMSNGATYTGVLSTVGSDTTVTVSSSSKQYEWKQTGLSHTVAEDSILFPFAKGSSSSTKYLRGTFYVIIEYTPT